MSFVWLLVRTAVFAVVVLLIAAAVIAAVVVRGGFSAREQPSAWEAFIARHVRLLAIPRDAREARDPVATTPEVLVHAREHYGEECALCHGDDGSGDSAIGQQMYPKPPDLRKPATQSLSDGEIYYIIMNGARFTGMPAWASDDPQENREHWILVNLIRHLPQLTPQEMEEIHRAASAAHQHHHENSEPEGVAAAPHQ